MFALQAEKGYGFFLLEDHALRMFIAGPVLWLVGSIHNSCQIYERSDAHIQILQQAVLVPFLMTSLLFLVGAIINSQEHDGNIHHGLELLVKCKLTPLFYLLLLTIVVLSICVN